MAVLKTKLVALGAPEKLRESLWGRKTVIQLERVTEAVLAAVKRAGSWSVEVDGNKLTIAVRDPEKENPDIVNAIGVAGGRVQFVSAVSPTLEDMYLRLVRS